MIDQRTLVENPKSTIATDLMPKRSSRSQAGPSEGIQQAPTAPSVSGQANNSEAAKALSKTARRKKRQREADGLTGSTVCIAVVVWDAAQLIVLRCVPPSEHSEFGVGRIWEID